MPCSGEGAGGSGAPSSSQLRSSTGIDVGLTSDAPAVNFSDHLREKQKKAKRKRRREQLRCCERALKLPRWLEPCWAMLLVTSTVWPVLSSGWTAQLSKAGCEWHSPPAPVTASLLHLHAGSNGWSLRNREVTSLSSLEVTPLLR